MSTDELYKWLCEMNDHEVTNSEKSYIDSKFAQLESKIEALNARLELVVRQIPTWSK